MIDRRNVAHCRGSAELLGRGERGAVSGDATAARNLSADHVPRPRRRDDRAAVQAAVDVGTQRPPSGRRSAPDFVLPVLRGDRTVTLSTEYRQKPVVLVFGSYT